MIFLKITKDDKIGWKIFFGFFVYCNISITILYSVMSVKPSSIESTIDLMPLLNSLVFILTVFAFFFFAWNKKLFNKLFWQVAFILASLWKIGSLAIFLISFNSWSEVSPAFIVSSLISMILFVIMPFVALFCYAFLDDIWDYHK